jgi:hypothetical protein
MGLKPRAYYGFLAPCVPFKGNLVKTDSILFDSFELLQENHRASALSHFRTVPHEVPIARDRLRKPRVKATLIQLQNARAALAKPPRQVLCATPSRDTSPTRSLR